MQNLSVIFPRLKISISPLGQKKFDPTLGLSSFGGTGLHLGGTGLHEFYKTECSRVDVVIV